MDILKKPLVTEKSSSLTEFNKFVFIVDKTANKLQIKNAVEKMYGVKVTDVNTVNYQGKVRHRQTKTKFLVGRTNSYKKAFITVADGEIIDFYGNI